MDRHEQLIRELAMIADARSLIRDTEGPDFAIPTTVPDRLLDELNQPDDQHKPDPA